MPAPEDSLTAQLYGAAIEDLRYLAQLLRHVETEPGRSSLDPSDIRISVRAGKLARELEAMIGEAERGDV